MQYSLNDNLLNYYKCPISKFHLFVGLFKLGFFMLLIIAFS